MYDKAPYGFNEAKYVCFMIKNIQVLKKYNQCVGLRWQSNKGRV